MIKVICKGSPVWTRGLQPTGWDVANHELVEQVAMCNTVLNTPSDGLLVASNLKGGSSLLLGRLLATRPCETATNK